MCGTAAWALRADGAPRRGGAAQRHVCGAPSAVGRLAGRSGCSAAEGDSRAVEPVANLVQLGRRLTHDTPVRRQ